MTWLAAAAIPKGILGHFSDEERDLPRARHAATTRVQHESMAIADSVHKEIYERLARANDKGVGISDIEEALPQIDRALTRFAGERSPRDA
jgi:hypothetical protein